MTNLSGGIVTTRKPHKCWGCAQDIPVGGKVESSVSVDMGKAIRTYWCDVCLSVMADMWEGDLESIPYGTIRSDDVATWEEHRERMMTLAGDKEEGA